MRELEDAVVKVISEIKKLKGVREDDLKYEYEYETKEYNIIHRLQDRIESDDKLTEEIASILTNYLYSKGYYNINFYEDSSKIINHKIK